MELSYIFLKKVFLNFRKWTPSPKNFSGGNVQSSKKILKNHSEKMSYISVNGTFVPSLKSFIYFRRGLNELEKQKFVIFL